MMSAFETTAATFEKWADDYAAHARKLKEPAAKAAVMREVAHYLACAARLRGTPIDPVRLPGPRRRFRFPKS